MNTLAQAEERGTGLKNNTTCVSPAPIKHSQDSLGPNLIGRLSLCWQQPNERRKPEKPNIGQKISRDP
jgi:hypothetical protein